MQEKICKKECHSRSFFQRHVLPFQVRVCICRGKPLWVYLIGIYVFVLNLGPMYDGILTIISWRKPHLEHACTYISRSSIHVRSLFQGLPVRILISIYSFACFCKPTFYFLCFLSAFPWGSLLRTFFLVALWSFLTCRHLSCFYYFPLPQRWLVEMLVFRSFLFRWYLFFSCSSIVGVVFLT